MQASGKQVGETVNDDLLRELALCATPGIGGGIGG